jgi:cell division protease FtsH
MWLPQEDKYNMRKLELIDSLCVTMGGRVAEELVFGDVTSGARGDIKQATGMARKMVCEWGMSEKLGMVEYGEHDDYVFLGRELSRQREYSEATAQEIDREVRKLCDDAYSRAKDLLSKYREKLDAIAKALLEFETLDGSQIRDIIDHGTMKNPPSAPPRGPIQPTPVQQNAPSQGLSPDYPTGLTEAPA